VKRIEALFGLIDSIEAKWRAARDRVDQLTPTLLEMAFCGELVARDPIDLPASALLSALAADKVNLVPTRPKRRDKSMRANMKAAPKYSFMEIVEKMEEDEFSFDELKSRSSQDYESLKAELFAALSASKPLIEQYFDADVKSIRLRRTGR
jgi:type I restriction enzyme S subunit